jgi:hypothetical protein
MSAPRKRERIVAQMQRHDQVERHLSDRLDEQAAAELVAFVQCENRLDQGHAGSRKARVCAGLF